MLLAPPMIRVREEGKKRSFDFQKTRFKKSLFLANEVIFIQKFAFIKNILYICKNSEIYFLQ